MSELIEEAPILEGELASSQQSSGESKQWLWSWTWGEDAKKLAEKSSEHPLADRQEEFAKPQQSGEEHSNEISSRLANLELKLASKNAVAEQIEMFCGSHFEQLQKELVKQQRRADDHTKDLSSQIAKLTEMLTTMKLKKEDAQELSVPEVSAIEEDEMLKKEFFADQLWNADQRAEILAAQVAKLKGDLMKSQEKITHLQNKLDQPPNELDTQTPQKAKQENRVKAASTPRGYSQQSIARLEHRVHDLMSSLTSSTQREQEQKNRVKELETKIAVMAGRAGKKNEEDKGHQSVQTDRCELEHRIAELEEKLVAEQGSKTELQSALNLSHLQGRAYVDEKQAAQLRSAELEAQVAREQKLAIEMQCAFAELQEKFVAEQKLTDDLQSKLAVQENFVAEQKLIDDLQSKLAVQEEFVAEQNRTDDLPSKVAVHEKFVAEQNGTADLQSKPVASCSSGINSLQHNSIPACSDDFSRTNLSLALGPSLLLQHKRLAMQIRSCSTDFEEPSSVTSIDKQAFDDRLQRKNKRTMTRR
eukprot:gnl/MRDRNA2_/MRDRNA2_29494_c0_seq2.p1 gnl/MRDRNA2_/MRDRNA2_29494_c0~~gnl/MRDRNA2_/MRDRNA2_29494_c0_seq2.p1  ORF type:complete len:532 (+),score=156.32 gnl/MRDRNA2_/MRDRNA2_29494_c0_seq2:110-1705(+)